MQKSQFVHGKYTHYKHGFKEIYTGNVLSCMTASVHMMVMMSNTHDCVYLDHNLSVWFVLRPCPHGCSGTSGSLFLTDSHYVDLF